MSQRKVLFVDDEANILQACRRTLRRMDFDVVTASSAAEGLEALNRDEFAAVVSDQRMPEVTGTEFLEEVRLRTPDAVRIILTGYADLYAAVDAINRGRVFRFVSKPWNDEDLRAVVAEAVAQFEFVLEHRRLGELTTRQNAELTELARTLEARVAERTAEVTRLCGELKESLFGAIRVLSEATELHSPLIGRHAKRVGRMAKDVARLMGAAESEIVAVEIAGMLHDVGTIAEAAAAGSDGARRSTSSGERARAECAMRGAAIVELVPHLESAAEMVRRQCERFDGSGLPDGLCGEGIPLGARIIAVVDAYDSRLHDAAAFHTASPAHVLQWIVKSSGREYDPSVVRALIETIAVGKVGTAEGDTIDLRIRDLRPGMTLARDFITSQGMLVLRAGVILDPTQLQRLQSFATSHVGSEEVCIYRRAEAVTGAVPMSAARTPVGVTS
jgi:response regulator RpfG family c-di-GMP phosphodiesterase